MKENSEVNFCAPLLAVVFIILQCLMLPVGWAADKPLPPVTWRYKFILPEAQVIQHDNSIRKAAAKSNATVAYAIQDKADKSAVQVVLDGRSSVTELKEIILGVSPGIKNLIDQPIKVNIKGYAAKQSKISLILTSNITTGYQWRLDTTNLGLVAGNETGEYEQTSPLLGGAGRQTFVLNPLEDGNVEILINYGRHWDTAAEEPGTLDIQVEGSLPQTLDLSDPSAVSEGMPLLNQETPTPSAQLTGSADALLGLPTSYDWRNSGGLSSVKNQGQCGSCWAFSTVGVLEGLIKINSGANVDLSEQFLVSCNKSSWSCNGGWFAHDYHKSTLGSQQSVAGAVLEADKPYTATNGTCTPIPNHQYSLANWSYVGTRNAVPSTDAIKNAIYSYGPVAAAVCVGSAFSRYSSGVFATNEASTCAANAVNHAIVLVGWDDSTQTWLLRNSWGTSWGESGYMRIAWVASNIGYGANYARYSNTCTYGISPTSDTRTTTGGPGSIALTTQSGCAWTASSNASWISLSSGSSGSGSGTVAYVVSFNAGSARTGTITAAGQSFTVTQQGAASCTYTTSTSSITPSAAGATGNITVTTQSGCAWTTSNTLGWASIVSGSSGTGSGTVVYSVSANTGSARTGTLTIAGKSVSIAQPAPIVCTYSLNSVNNSFNSSGGSSTVSVITQSSCAWTATSNASWLTLSSGASGTGSGTVSYSASANTSTASRSGSLTIGGQTFAINQLGGSQGGDAQLSNGVALVGQTLTATDSGATWKYYSFAIPSGAANLVIDLYGLAGDLDLFGRQGDKPTFSTFDCGSYQSDLYNEQCVITSPTPGTWWIGVNNWDIGIINYTIRASWGALDIQLQNGIAANGSVASSPTMTWKYFYIDVPAGATSLVADLYNLTGDADVYLKYGSKPDINSVDECDSVNTGTTPEKCTITSPASGRWWLAVVNYEATVNYSIKATSTGGVPTAPSIVPTSSYIASPSSIGMVTVVATSASSWSASSNASWITITAGRTGTGNGTVSYTVSANTSTSARIGTLTIGGQTFTINQNGTGASTYVNQVQTMYIAYFGRAADPDGLSYYTNLMHTRNGSNAAMLDDFSNSSESLGLYNQPSIATKLNQVYRFLFGRDADPGGSAYWTDLISSGKITLSTAAYIIAFNAQPADAAVLAVKQSAAAIFSAHLDTPAKIQAYGNNVAPGRTWLATVMDSSTAIRASATVDSVIGAL